MMSITVHHRNTRRTVRKSLQPAKFKVTFR
jgi:hypothetical protein